jgi:hypothetical protein
VDRRNASIMLQTEPAAVSRFSGDRKPACSKRGEITQHGAARNAQFVGKSVDGGHVTATQKIGEHHEAVGARHLW